MPPSKRTLRSSSRALAPTTRAWLCARERILSLGGIQAANSYVKINLSLFDLYPRELCPSIPPELMLLPHDFIYQMSSWTRAIVIPLSIVHAMNPRRPVPDGFNLNELFIEGGAKWSWFKDRQLPHLAKHFS